jgi:hypothetical protein
VKILSVPTTAVIFFVPRPDIAVELPEKGTPSTDMTALEVTSLLPSLTVKVTNVKLYTLVLLAVNTRPFAPLLPPPSSVDSVEQEVIPIARNNVKIFKRLAVFISDFI